MLPFKDHLSKKKDSNRTWITLVFTQIDERQSLNKFLPTKRKRLPKRRLILKHLKQKRKIKNKYPKTGREVLISKASFSMLHKNNLKKSFQK